MSKDPNETHISVTLETKEKLKALAKLESRTMRTVIARLVMTAHEKAKAKK